MSGRLRRPSAPGRHDGALWRRASRKGRERGCSLYIAADELAAVGIDPYGEPPSFKVWTGGGRALIINLRQTPAPPADESEVDRGT